MKTFRAFKKFLAEECFDLKKYREGKYDRKIYNWFLSEPKYVQLKIPPGYYAKGTKIPG